MFLRKFQKLLTEVAKRAGEKAVIEIPVIAPAWQITF